MKKLKALVLGLIATLGLTGCGIGEWVNDRVCEQKIEFYQVAKDPETDIGEAAVTDGKDVYFAFTWNAANKIVSKVEQKAVEFKTWVSTPAGASSKLAETSISLKSKDHEKIDEKIIKIDAFEEGDDKVFSPYAITVGNKYTGDKDGNVALRVHVDLSELYRAAEITSDVFEAHYRIATGSGASSTIAWKYEKVSDTEFETYYKETKIVASGAMHEFLVGEEFSTEGLEVKVEYENKKIPARVLSAEEYEIDASAVDMSKTGEYVVTITYGDFTTTYKVNVYAEPEQSEPVGDSSEPEPDGSSEEQPEGSSEGE